MADVYDFVESVLSEVIQGFHTVFYFSIYVYFTTE